jgi:hypothetical protein
MKNRGKTFISSIVAGLVLLLAISIGSAAIPYTINYQGYLTDNSGNPVNTNVSMTFKIYTTAAGGTALWTETQNNVSVNNGIYNVILGSVASLSTLAFDVPYFLGVAVGTDAEMTPRQPLTSVAYAFTADTALNAADIVSALDGSLGGAAGTSNLFSRADHRHPFTPGAITSLQINDNAVTSFKILDGTITSADVGFNYAGSTSKGGAASDLNCTGCVSQTELNFSPLLTETDPQVGTLTSNLWCASNAGATAIDCTKPAPTLSGWTDDGTVVRLTINTDRVGIGTATVSEELHVKDTGGIAYLQAVFQGVSSSGGIALIANNGQQYELQSLNNGGFALFDRTDGKYALYVDTTQNVGIGDMTSPQQKLDVNGQIRAKSGYGDYIRLGGDNAGGDVEISIAAPAERNHVSFWNEQLAQAANLGAKNIFINGAAITTSGWTSPHLNLVLSSNTAYNSSILQAADGLLFRNFSPAPYSYSPVFSFRDSTDNILLEIRKSGEIGVKGIDTPYIRSGDGTFDNVIVYESLTKPFGSFKIDHPLDPENKYLYHSFVESPDMKNIYDGIVILNEHGEAWVDLPEWFEALNKDFRYQLTCVGGFAPVYIESEISDNRFKIAGGKEGMKVSWQVTGIRHDPIADLKRIKVEEYKSDTERGLYLYPEAYGQPKEEGIQHRKR